MAVFSVDSDAVLGATTVVRGTVDRLQAEASALHAQLGQLQSVWSGSAATAFQGVAEQWHVAHRQVEDALAALSGALAAAGRQYAEAEQASASLFR
jgi:6 kDa early secretory antigenic target